MSAIHLTKADFDQKTEKGVTLVDFWAPWCGPCRMAGPVIDSLATQFQNKALVAKVNVDEQGELAEKFGVMSIPTVVILKDGKEVERTTGFVGEDAYKEFLEKHLK